MKDLPDDPRDHGPLASGTTSNVPARRAEPLAPVVNEPAWAWVGPGQGGSTYGGNGGPRPVPGNDRPSNPKLAKLHAAARAQRPSRDARPEASPATVSSSPVTSLPIAGLNVRSLVAAIDFAVSCVVFTPLVLMSRHWFGLDSVLNPASFAGMDDILSMVQNALLMVLFLAWGILGASIFSALPMTSPGNRWMGLAVVDASTGRPPSTTQLVLRATVALVDNIFLMSLGSILMLFDPRRQGLRDKVAKTVVVADRRHARFP